MERLYGGIELGGTHCVCAVAYAPATPLQSLEFATTTPEETFEQAIAFFQPYAKRLRAIGIAAFGPLACVTGGYRFDTIAWTPKVGWSQTDLVMPLQRAFSVPIAVDTDVNAAALAEHSWGMAQGLDTFLYLTVGTGVGGSAVINGHLLHGLVHPEMGHIAIPHDWQADPFPGHCPYHGDCLEGLASGPAIAKRWGQAGESLPADHPGWSLEAHYLALGLGTLICALSPQRVILGGGVMQQGHLFAKIRAAVQARLNGYIQASALLQQIDTYIVPAALGDRAGVVGALALARSRVELS